MEQLELVKHTDRTNLSGGSFRAMLIVVLGDFRVNCFEVLWELLSIPSQINASSICIYLQLPTIRSRTLPKYLGMEVW